MSTHPPSVTLLCIPLIESTIPKEYIRRVFHCIQVTDIPKIVEIPNKKNPLYKRVILSVYLNTEIPIHQFIQKRLEEKKDIKLVHAEPWFWKITEAYKGK